MTPWALAIIAVSLLGYAAVSRRLAGTSVTAAMVFVGIGLLVGPRALVGLDAAPTGHSVRLLAEGTLTLVLFLDASRIDLRALRREYSVPVRLLGIGLPLTIVAGTIAAAALFSGLTLIEAVVVGILLAPTDAALGQAVVTLPDLPSRIRQGLNVESGLNDGICVPLLLIALAAAETQADVTSASHATTVVVEEIGYGLLGGLVAGALAAAIVVLGGRRGMIERTWLQLVPVSAALLAYGIAAPLGGSGFIAAFVGGVTFGGLRRRGGGEDTYFLDQAGGLLDAVTFLFFGAILLGPSLGHLTWQVALYAVLSLTVVRMVPVALAMWGSKAQRPTVAFLGWFGPRGLASIVFGVIVVEDAHLPHTATILVVTYVTVGLSVLAHGVSAAPLAARYARWYRSSPDDRLPPMESVHAPHQRWRSASSSS
ncbi:MAG: cation:proton antiporter [Gaiellaceae bacterium]